MITVDWPFISMGSSSADSTNCGLKIYGRKIPESFQKQNLNLLCWQLLITHGIYLVLGIISKLEMI